MTRSPSWLFARCSIDSVCDFESIEMICLAPQTSLCLGTIPSSSFMAASGIGTVVANSPTCRNLAFNSGVKSLTATWQGTMKHRGCCGRWGGKSSLCGNASFGIRAASLPVLPGDSKRIWFESDECVSNRSIHTLRVLRSAALRYAGTAAEPLPMTDRELRVAVPNARDDSVAHRTATEIRP